MSTSKKIVFRHNECDFGYAIVSHQEPIKFMRRHSKNMRLLYIEIRSKRSRCVQKKTYRDFLR